MRVGLFLAHYFPGDVDARVATRDIVARAVRAEELGFDSVFLGHHYLSAAQFLQPLSLAAYLAASTERITIGTGVYLLPLVNPLVVAEEVATVAVLADGRFVAGFGAGYREKEFQAVGVPFADRFKRLEEYVDIVRRLLDGESVTHDGSYGSLKNATVQLAAHPQARPELWLGAFGDVGVRRCARLGLPWLAGPEGSVEDLAARLGVYDEAAVKANRVRPSSMPLVRELLVADTDAEALALARPYLAKQYEDYKSWDHGLTIDELIQRDAVIGSPATVLGRLRAYESLGFTDVIVRSDWPGMGLEDSERSMQLLASQVVPHLRSQKS
jgi:alkanesulfonate monooxygenase SsuD/methylene tetrahydromethanopterin reductase-like flavin-dependent oxidoreductase (luciferase family)